MELNDLRKTWNQLSSGKDLNEEQIEKMLRHRTGNLINRIDRNVRIGIIILFVLILLFILDDFIFGPMLLRNIEGNIKIPVWLTVLSGVSNMLIFSAFIYFVIKYYKVRKSCDILCNLRESLLSIIKTLQIYQRLFYLTLFIFAFVLAVQFISGIYLGMTYGIEDQGMGFTEMPFNKWLVIIATGIFGLVVFAGGTFLLMRWGFRRLYGNYINHLEETLNELNEMNE